MNMGYETALEYLEYIVERELQNDLNKPLYDEAVKALEDIRWLVEEFKKQEPVIEGLRAIGKFLNTEHK